MILPANYDDFEPVIRGYSWDTSFIFQIESTPVDLTSYSAIMRIFDSFEDANPIITLSSASGDITLGSDGSVTIQMTPQQTETIPRGGKYYIIDLIYPGGSPKYQILVGRMRVVERG